MKRTRKSNESKAQILNYHAFRISRKRIEEICRRWKIKELSLFGSVLREDFHPKSDVDVLVSFEPNARWNSDQLLEMKEEFESLFKRSVDVVEKRLVEESPNYIRRKHILENMESIYVA
jgi:predicted nucleotidyltransferase